VISETHHSREDLYEIVQKASFNSSNINEFRKELEESSIADDCDFSYLSSLDETALRNIYLKNIDEVFTRSKDQYK
jgi:adenylosuccinate lyase